MSTVITPSRGPKFIPWTHFNTHTVPASNNFVQEHHKGILATYDTLNLEVKALNLVVVLDEYIKKICD
jgi:hypothetical protein